jgi:Flp pilus assembly protein CpaB
MSDSPAALTLPRGTVGVPVQLAEPGAAAVLRPGDRVDVIARTGSPQGTTDQGDEILAHDVLVISSSEDGIVYLAMPPQQAPRVSRMAPDIAVGVTVHPD